VPLEDWIDRFCTVFEIKHLGHLARKDHTVCFIEVGQVEDHEMLGSGLLICGASTGPALVKTGSKCWLPCAKERWFQPPPNTQAPLVLAPDDLAGPPRFSMVHIASAVGRPSPAARAERVEACRDVDNAPLIFDDERGFARGP
jgi:hypothetical protein